MQAVKRPIWLVVERLKMWPIATHTPCILAPLVRRVDERILVGMPARNSGTVWPG